MDRIYIARTCIFVSAIRKYLHCLDEYRYIYFFFVIDIERLNIYAEILYQQSAIRERRCDVHQQPSRQKIVLIKAEGAFVLFYNILREAKIFNPAFIKAGESRNSYEYVKRRENSAQSYGDKVYTSNYV